MSQVPNDGLDADATTSPGECTKNWTAAKDDSTKSMWTTYDETGIFGAVCRHGCALILCDMVQSGEL
jgi:hypothetical protein